MPLLYCPKIIIQRFLRSKILFRKRSGAISEKHERDFSGTRGSESRIALRHTPLFHPGGDTLDVLCYRDSGRGRSRGAKREEYTLSSGARVFDQDLSKGLVAPLWPAFRIGITCHCDQKRVSLATNINVPRDAAARSQCASQSL